MLIIFDLDDTLVDTSGCITPFKLKNALKCMIEAGLVVSDFNTALDSLHRMNQQAQSARHALQDFIRDLHGDVTLLEVGLKEVYDTSSVDQSLMPLEGAYEVLTELSSCHQLALVTVGKQVWQLEKMKKAGIDSSVFSKIVVSEENNKKIHYQELANELGYVPADILVCGDRIAIDLTPAAELGFNTVQMRWGRGLHSMRSVEDVHYEILSLRQLKEIIALLQR